MLDIGGGSGIYACSLVAHHPQLCATVFDQRPVDYEKLFYRGDKLRLTTRLRRRRSPIPFEVLPQIASKGKQKT